MTLHVEVTEEDIALGKHHCKGCPIYLALRRVAPKSWSQFAVTTRVVNYTVEEEDRYAILPLEAVCFILSFDHSFRLKMRPFSFSLDVAQT